MRQQEAEQEAARRNAEDERRDRFVFYALDHSAGMSEGAWEVEMRLRTDLEGPEPSAVPVGAGASEAAAEPVAEPSEAEDPLPDTRAYAPVETAEAVEPLPPPEPHEPHEPEPRGRRTVRQRVGAANPRVIMAAFALSPYPRPLLMPAPMAMMFLSAPPNSTPTTSSEV